MTSSQNGLKPELLDTRPDFLHASMTGEDFRFDRHDAGFLQCVHVPLDCAPKNNRHGLALPHRYIIRPPFEGMAHASCFQSPRCEPSLNLTPEFAFAQSGAGLSAGTLAVMPFALPDWRASWQTGQFGGNLQSYATRKGVAHL